MRLYIEKKDDNRHIVLGRIKSISSGANGNIAYIHLEGDVWDKNLKENHLETLIIEFHNTEEVKMADRTRAAKLYEGAIITAFITKDNGRVYGSNFKYQGHWRIPEGDGYMEKNIFHGRITTIDCVTNKENEEIGVKISMPVNGPKNRKPYWSSMTFWKGKDAENSELLENVKKCLQIKTIKDESGQDIKVYPEAVIVCGPGKKFKDRDYYTAYNFHVIKS